MNAKEIDVPHIANLCSLLTALKSKDVAALNLLFQSKDPSILRSIVKDANQNLGIYSSVVKSGNVSEGARVELL